MHPEKFNSSHLTVEKLSEKHDLSSFHCNKDDISKVDDFIHNEALKYQKENMGISHLFFYNDEIVGFVTLSMTHIEGKDTPDPPSLAYFGRKKPPSILIGTPTKTRRASSKPTPPHAQEEHQASLSTEGKRSLNYRSSYSNIHQETK